MMRDNLKFEGRGQCPVEDNIVQIIRCESGSVIAIYGNYRGHDLLIAYSRMVVMNRWSAYCKDSFCRASDVGLKRTWAVPSNKKLFLHRAITMEIVTEEEWMKKTE